MSEKKGSHPNISEMLDFLKPLAQLGGDAMIAVAIRDFTRTFVANDYYRRSITGVMIFEPAQKEGLMKEAYQFADNFIAAGKPPKAPPVAGEEEE